MNEVGYLRMELWYIKYENIFRLHVSMNYTTVVKCGNATSDVKRDALLCGKGERRIPFGSHSVNLY